MTVSMQVKRCLECRCLVQLAAESSYCGSRCERQHQARLAEQEASRPPKKGQAIELRPGARVRGTIVVHGGHEAEYSGRVLRGTHLPGARRMRVQLSFDAPLANGGRPLERTIIDVDLERHELVSGYVGEEKHRGTIELAEAEPDLGEVLERQQLAEVLAEVRALARLALGGRVQDGDLEALTDKALTVDELCRGRWPDIYDADGEQACADCGTTEGRLRPDGEEVYCDACR